VDGKARGSREEWKWIESPLTSKKVTGSLESVMVTLSNSVVDPEHLDLETATLCASMVALLHTMVDILDPEHEFGLYGIV